MSQDNSNNDRKPKQIIQEDVPHFRRVDMKQPSHDTLQMASTSIPKMPLRSAMSSRKPATAACPPPASPTSSNWEVQTPLVMPYGYFLERHNVKVSGTPAAGISQRIGNHLHSQSIAFTFDNEQSVARAETVCRVKFSIRLWQAASDVVVVEVQRTTGCGFLFQQIAKAVMAVAQGNPARVQVTRQLPKALSAMEDFNVQESILEGISLACTCLQTSSRRDAHVLALDSLAQLSAQKSAVDRITSDVALWDTIVELAQYTEDEDHFRTMHRHAVTILGNCIENGDCDLSNPALVAALEMNLHGECPHDAAAAARCLRLMGVKPELERPACRHAALQAECAKLFL